MTPAKVPLSTLKVGTRFLDYRGQAWVYDGPDPDGIDSDMHLATKVNDPHFKQKGDWRWTAKFRGSDRVTPEKALSSV